MVEKTTFFIAFQLPVFTFLLMGARWPPRFEEAVAFMVRLPVVAQLEACHLKR